jgi:YVTN family beta-propeller protein/VCBS repeat-containing protein
VANQAANTVSVIDTTTNAVVKTITVGSRPTGIVASPDQTKVYVANGWSATVSVIDTTTNAVTATIGVGGGPVGVAISNDGTRLYVSNASSNTVSVVNTATRTVISTINVGAFPYGATMSPDGTRLYVNNQNSNTVSVINTVTSTVVATLAVGATPTSVAVGNTRALVTNQGGNSVSVIDTTTATPTVISTIALGANTAPTSVIFSKDGTVAYVANSNDTVSVIDMTSATPAIARTVTIDTTAEVGVHQLALSADGTKVYLTDAADNMLRSLSFVRGNTAPVAGSSLPPTVDTVSGKVTGALSFTDPDGDTLSFSVPTQPGAGTVTVNSSGGYSFTPTDAARDAAATPQGAKTATFNVMVSDGRTSVAQSVTVTIAPSQPGVNRPPVAGTPTVGIPNASDGAVSGQLNFTDADSDPLTYNVPNQPSSGNLTLNGTGGYTFKPTQAARDAAAQSPGADTVTFIVTATDGKSAAVQTQVTVPILPTPGSNTAPEVTGTTVSTPDQSTGAITGAVTASDQDGDTLTYSLSGGQPSTGSVTVNSNGTFTYTPTQAARLAAAQTTAVDQDSFTVAISDGETTTTTTVTVAVPSANVTVASTTTPTGVSPIGVVVVGTKAYVANQSSNSVSVIDTSTKTVVKTISVGYAPTGVAAAPDQTKVYVANGWSNTVSVIDTATNTVTATIAVGSGPVAVAVSNDGSRLYVANASGNSVSVVNTATRAVISTVAVGAFPNGVTVSRDGNRLYVTNQNSNTVSVINTAAATPSVVATLAVGGSPSSVAVGATRALVTNQGGNSITVIDTTLATPTVISTIALANAAPTKVILSKDGTVAYVANGNDTLSVIDMTKPTLAVVSTVTTDSVAEYSAHSLALSADGTRVYLTDSADNVLRSVSLAPDGSTTSGHAPLTIPGTNGYTVDAAWYFPNQSQPPVGVIYLQHGYLRSNSHVSALAQQLADQTNSIVVTPQLSSNIGDPFNIWDATIERGVTKLFEGNRAELTASASAAAGHPVTLPQQFVLAGHSAGGNLAVAVAGYLADDNAIGNLKAVILFDSVDDGDTVVGMAKLTGSHTVPVMLIAAPPCSCNNFGVNTTTVLNNAPDQFIGVMLDNGGHLDSEGSTTDAIGVQFCGPTPTPANAAAVQTITAAWIDDVFTGSHTGIYGPAGAVIPINGATARVIGVGTAPIGQNSL